MAGPYRVGIVIPTFNALDYARRAAETALANTPDPLVILVDDGSPTWKEGLWKGLPEDRFRVVRFKENRGLTRGWNHGLRMCREAGVVAAVAGNSDVLFPPGWWTAMGRAVEDNPDLLAGPVTNAPGHRPRQNVAKYLPGYKLSDDAAYLAKVQARLLERWAGKSVKDRVNGFCLVASMRAWEKYRFDADHFFDPKFRMTKNEDELQGRWKKAGGLTAIVPASFVFHYRGVTRKNATRGPEGRGWFRPAGSVPTRKSVKTRVGKGKTVVVKKKKPVGKAKPKRK